MEVRDRLRLQDDCEGVNSTFCDVSTVAGSNTSLSEDPEYRISARKSRSHMHSSANCYAMIRSVRPIIRERRRPRPPHEFDNVTSRSQVRDSNMHDQASSETCKSADDDSLSAPPEGAEQMITDASTNTDPGTTA